MEGKSALPKTRKQVKEGEEKKKKDRERKKVEKQNQTSQKRLAENKKAVERRRKKKDVVIAQVPESPEITTEPPINDRSTAARAMSLSRLNKALPKKTDQKHQKIGDFFSTA